jgi:hypothetical protein
VNHVKVVVSTGTGRKPIVVGPFVSDYGTYPWSIPEDEACGRPVRLFSLQVVPHDQQALFLASPLRIEGPPSP